METNQNIIVENYLALAKSICLKFIKNQDLKDSDIYGCACLALVDASKSYDPNKGAFTTWATRKITQAIINYLRKNKKVDFLGESTLEIRDKTNDKIPTDILSVLLENNKKESKIEKQNKKILLDHFIENKSWAEIGRSLNLSRERVRQKGQQALKQIQEKCKFIIEDFEPFFGE